MRIGGCLAEGKESKRYPATSSGIYCSFFVNYHLGGLEPYKIIKFMSFPMHDLIHEHPPFILVHNPHTQHSLSERKDGVLVVP